MKPDCGGFAKMHGGMFFTGIRLVITVDPPSYFAISCLNLYFRQLSALACFTKLMVTALHLADCGAVHLLLLHGQINLIALSRPGGTVLDLAGSCRDPILLLQLTLAWHLTGQVAKPW